MVLGGSCPGGNCPGGSCPRGVIALRGSCPRGSCPQGSCPRGSCPRGSCPVTWWVPCIIIFGLWKFKPRILCTTFDFLDLHPNYNLSYIISFLLMTKVYIRLLNWLSGKSGFWIMAICMSSLFFLWRFNISNHIFTHAHARN